MLLMKENEERWDIRMDSVGVDRISMTSDFC